MVTLPLGVGAYKRAYAGEPEVRLENRFLEVDPTNLREKITLLSRCGDNQFKSLGLGPIRGNYSTLGLFEGALFTVSGNQLFRTDTDGTVNPITGVINGDGHPNVAWMKGIGYEMVFIADGLLLQYYNGGTQATGKLSDTTYSYAWTTRTAPNTNTYQDIDFSPSLTLFVAVGHGASNSVITSPDGTTWTARTPATTDGWNAVCWSPDISLWVAVSGTGTIMTSANGTSWTSRTSPITTALRSVCWASDISLFVAVGAGGGIITSPDGITWTSRTAAVANDWWGVCRSPDLGLFVATSVTGLGNRVMTSPDGINWQTQASASDSEWEDVVWSPELSIFCATAAAAAMTSPDGITWTLQKFPSTVDGHGIAWSKELGVFTVVGGAGGYVATSPDGITWTIRTPASSQNWQKVIWSSALNLFAAVSNSGLTTSIMTSAGTTSNITNQVIEVDGVYYSWNANVDNNSPDGTSSHPWLAKLGATSADSLTAMANLFNFNGTQGVDFSTALDGPNTVVTATNDTTSMTLTAISQDTDGNAITTSIFSGSGLTWGGATLSGGGVHALKGVAMPDGKVAKGLTSLSGYVLVSVGDSQEFFWLLPGETTIDPLNFAEKESNPDNIVDMLTLQDQAGLMGQGSTESWYATGDPNAPFLPIAGRVYARGIIEGTAVVVKDQIILVGDDGVVYALVGGGVKRISNHGIEERIRTQLRREQGLT